MRKTILLAAALALIAAPAHAQLNAAAAPSDTAQDVADRLAQIGALADVGFERFMAENHVPGLAWGIVADGRLAYVRTFGSRTQNPAETVTPDTLFRIASMSKAFTALAILKLRDEGRLRLDDLAQTHVPEMRDWRYPTSDSPRIRVRDLLSHVGGFVTDDPWGDRQQVLTDAEFTAILRAGVPFTRAPGTRHEYSNFGYALLGRIISNISGRRYQDYIRDEIMRPLGMESTGYDVFASPQERRALGWRWENGAYVREPDMRDGAFGAMGGVETSARDYARWVAFLLSAWPARDGPETGPVRRATVRELAEGLNFVSVTRRPGNPDSCAQAGAYGMGFRVAQDWDLGLTLAHGGGYPGYGSHLMLMPDYGVGIFALSNRTYAGPSGPAWGAAAALAEAGLLAPRPQPVSDALALLYHHAGDIWDRGNLDGAEGRLAMNFLMDRSAENWTRTLAELKAESGECETASPIAATGILSGNFTWVCARGDIQGQLLLAPTMTPTIQALRFRFVPTP